MEAQSNANTLDAAEDTSSSKKKKIIATSAVILLALALAMSGTFAWQSLAQQQTNEAYNGINAGGRLHDDFIFLSSEPSTAAENEAKTPENTFHDKDIYVENYLTTVPVYARVKLTEYMEIGTGAGQPDNSSGKTATKVGTGTLADKSTWDPHISSSTGAASTDPFHTYFTWNEGGQSTYMPTFDMNNTSEKADVRGEAPDYAEYKKYAVNETEIGNQLTADDPTGSSDENANQTHTAQNTGTATIMSMEEWKANPVAGECWVYDTDGWAYWAQPIEANTATGLLLDDIQINTDPGATWYYAIDAKAEIVDSTEWSAGDDGNYYLDKGKTATMTQDAFNLLNVAAGIDNKESYTIEIAAVSCNGEDMPSDNAIGKDTVTQFRPTVTKNGASVSEDVIWTATATDNDSTTVSIDDKGLLNVNMSAFASPWSYVTVNAKLEKFQTVVSKDVTLTISKPGSYETSKKKLNAMTVSDSVTDYVTLDDIQWYKIGEETIDGKKTAMIWAKDVVTAKDGGMDMAFGSSSKWVTYSDQSDGGNNVITGTQVESESDVRNYLNSDTGFKSLLSDNLKGDIAPKTLYTRQSYDATTWIQSTDDIFLLSEADLFGSAADQTVDPKDYTVPSGTQIDVSLLPWTATDDTNYAWLRSPYTDPARVASFTYVGVLSNGTSYNLSCTLRPALQVSLS